MRVSVTRNMRPSVRPTLCPGGVCDCTPARRAGGNFAQGLIVVAFVGVVGFVAGQVIHRDATSGAPAGQGAEPGTVDTAEAERCKVPEFAKALGHDEKWKLHHNCK